ncbi:MAG: phosphatase PAP2 family protein [Bacteroidales bacterium]|nr:phosphatase PAP2 family protein [Bacteroidales bacterium]
MLFSKIEIHLWINKFHNNFFDHFFVFVTLLGDGLFVLFVSFLFLIYRIRYGIGIIFTFLISGIIAQIIKHITNVPRPVKYFENVANLHIVDGVKMLTSHSFPSGHSASAFALCLSLAFILKNRLWQILLLLTAATIAYSRVYLSQHFLIDIWVGSAIGVVVATFYWYYEAKLPWKWLEFSIYERLTTSRSNKLNK